MTTITPLALPDVLLITPKRHGDARGWFSETWNKAALAEAGVVADFIQDNQAFSAQQGTVRGFHFQNAPNPQAKLVRALRGAIYDVAVDIRPGSPTFGQWVGAELTAERGEQLLVPHGFGHAYCTLTPDCEIFYKVDGAYSPADEGGFLWSDPAVGVDWPVTPDKAITSGRDATLPLLADMPAARF
jgi:dTDP-4-dehydrorhamnose 3,5-epimerase